MQPTKQQINWQMWLIISMLVVIIILLLINKFPINVEIKENKQTWEANCNCECIEKTSKPCQNISWNFTMPKSFYVNYTWEEVKFNLSQECRTCWLESTTP